MKQTRLLSEFSRPSEFTLYRSHPFVVVTVLSIIGSYIIVILWLVRLYEEIIHEL